MRQQNCMKSFRSQSLLDFTISQKVSSAGAPCQERKRRERSDSGSARIILTVLCLLGTDGALGGGYIKSSTCHVLPYASLVWQR